MRFAPIPRLDRLAGAAKSPTVAVVGTVALSNVVRIFSSAVLTRLLTAADYGVVGIITSLTYIIVMLSDFGFFAFVVRHKDADDPRFLDEVWTIRLIRGAALTMILVALAYPYALYTGKSVLAPAIAVWAFNQLLEGFTSMAFAQAVRRGMVARLSWMEFGVNIVQVAIAIPLAIILHNYWSIVFAGLVSSVVKVFASYRFFPHSRRRLAFNSQRNAEMWHFSRFIAGSSFLTLLLGQSDKLVLSRILPLALFGIYSIATLLALAPRAMVYPYCNRILYPAYSHYFREAGLTGFARCYYGTRRLVSLLYAFALGGLIGCAPLVVAILYDDRYAGVAPLLRIIALSAGLLLNNVAAEQAMIAIGRVKAPFQINLIRCAWLGGMGTIGLIVGGPMGIVWAVGTMEVAAMLFAWFLLFRIGAFRIGEELFALGCLGGGGLVGLAAGNAILSLGIF